MRPGINECLTCNVTIDQRFDAEIVDREQQHVLDGDMPRWDVCPVQPLVADSGPRAEVEMRLGNRASPIWMPVEGDDLPLVSIHERVVVADGDDLPQTICISVSYYAIEKDQTEMNSSNS